LATSHHRCHRQWRSIDGRVLVGFVLVRLAVHEFGMPPISEFYGIAIAIVGPFALIHVQWTELGVAQTTARS